MTGPAHQRAAALVTVLSSAVGVLVGLAWWLLTPLARLENRADGVFAVGLREEAAVAADGWFAACAVVAGAVTAALVAFLVHQRLAGLAGVAIGGVLGSVLAWRLGSLLGPPSIEASAVSARVGARFDGPLDLSALGVLLAWPMAATVVYFAIVAGLDARHAQDAHEAQGTQQQV